MAQYILTCPHEPKYDTNSTDTTAPTNGVYKISHLKTNKVWLNITSYIHLKILPA